MDSVFPTRIMQRSAVRIVQGDVGGAALPRRTLPIRLLRARRSFVFFSMHFMTMTFNLSCMPFGSSKFSTKNPHQHTIPAHPTTTNKTASYIYAELSTGRTH